MVCLVVLGAGSASFAQTAIRRSAQQDPTFSLAVAGDIACKPGEVGAPPDGKPNGPDNCQQAETAQLIESLNPDAVATPGDIQYQFGHLSEFLGSFDPTWGAFKAKIYPAPGNHEWYDSPTNGQGYFDYFNGVGAPTGRAGDRGKGYYSVDLNRYWHLITLNSNCTSDNKLIVTPVPCNPGSAQEQWLQADLAAHPNQCIIAQWHHPLFTSGPNQAGPNDLATQSFWNDLYAAGATLVLNGHDHGYERFARQTNTGAPDHRHGIREFVVGTGGKSLFGPGPLPAANSELYDNTTFGVLLLTLHPHSYQWNFTREPVAGNGTLTDQGSAPCNTTAQTHIAANSH
jgi:3',5'-cyclic AMP phosphodiesterase CpdA